MSEINEVRDRQNMDTAVCTCPLKCQCLAEEKGCKLDSKAGEHQYPTNWLTVVLNLMPLNLIRSVLFSSVFKTTTGHYRTILEQRKRTFSRVGERGCAKGVQNQARDRKMICHLLPPFVTELARIIRPKTSAIQLGSPRAVSIVGWPS